jgi:hypothetical protein
MLMMLASFHDLGSVICQPTRYFHLLLVTVAPSEHFSSAITGPIHNLRAP